MENSDRPEGSSQQFSADKLKETLGRYVNHKFIMERAKQVLTNPKGCWTAIKEDARPMQQIYKDYLLVLAAIPPLALFIKSIVAGYYFFPSLFFNLLSYVVSLAVVWGGAVIIEKLAPKFDGAADNMSAFKLLAYAATPTYLAGIFNLFGVNLAALVGLLAFLYFLYIYYLGVGEMTTVPEQKRVSFVAVSLLAIALTFGIGMVIVGAIAGPQFPQPKSIRIQGSNITIDPAKIQKDLERFLPNAK